MFPWERAQLQHELLHGFSNSEKGIFFQISNSILGGTKKGSFLKGK